jgi:hypothetical protein
MTSIIERLSNMKDQFMTSIVVNEDTLNELNTLLAVLDKYASEYRAVKPIPTVCVVVYRATYDNHFKMLRAFGEYGLMLELQKNINGHSTLRRLV